MKRQILTQRLLVPNTSGHLHRQGEGMVFHFQDILGLGRRPLPWIFIFFVRGMVEVWALFNKDIV